MFGLFSHGVVSPTGLLTSNLFNERTFYKALLSDLRQCHNEVIIESPFITGNRVASLLPIFDKMRSRDVRITVNTRDPSEHDAPYDIQATDAVEEMQRLGVQVLFTGRHHRKLAIIDRRILWEGSLNVLSQSDSCEVMRRIDSSEMAQQMIQFVKLDKFL